jgi:hypothetical protein
MFTEVFLRCETPDGLKQAFKKHPTVFKSREYFSSLQKAVGPTPTPLLLMFECGWKVSLISINPKRIPTDVLVT